VLKGQITNQELKVWQPTP